MEIIKAIFTPVSTTSFQRCWCEINLKAFKHNLAWLRNRVGADVAIMALLKADAYGHGALALGKFLDNEDCQMFGCAHVHEAVALREVGVKKNILLLSGFFKEELPDILKHEIQVTLSSVQDVREVARVAKKLKCKARVHLKVDTGMSRMGAQLDQIPEMISEIKKHTTLGWIATYTHYACADEDASFTNKQWKKFQSQRSNFDSFHTCNSAGTLYFRGEPYGSMVRPGLALYGISPLPQFQKFLEPVMSWKSRVALVKTISKGTPVSYGATFVAPKKMRIATVTVGYGDGFMRSLSNKGKVLIGGKRCSIVGRVNMDQMMVDVTKVPKIKKGDEVVLLGTQGKETLTATEVAQWAGTIPYEVWTHITPRVKKIYRK